MGVNQVVFGSVKIMDISDSTVTADSMMAGDVAYGADGEKVVGTFSLDNELTTQDDLISQITTALEGKAAGGGSGAEILFAYAYGSQLDRMKITIPFTTGMTWQEWIDTGFNTYPDTTSSTDKLLKLSGSYIESNLMNFYQISEDGTAAGRVLKTDTIIEGLIYSYYCDD